MPMWMWWSVVGGRPGWLPPLLPPATARGRSWSSAMAFSAAWPRQAWWRPHLVPQRVENLLVAGRCISATHEGMAGARVMGTCMAIGQAAGTAAALAVQGDLPPRRVDVQALRRTLSADGALV